MWELDPEFDMDMGLDWHRNLELNGGGDAQDRIHIREIM